MIPTLEPTLIHNAIIPGAPQGVSRVLFNDRIILAVGGEEITGAVNKIDAGGNILLPGVIDAHVHFREPGLTHKADIATESRAALSGGVTSYFDMPNTVPQTTTVQAWHEKMEIAARVSASNYAFFIGASNENFDELLKADFSQIPGIKIFMGSSTGNMLVDSSLTLEKIFAHFKVPLVIHSEDENIISLNKEKLVRKFNGNVPVSEHSNIRSEEACVVATARALDILARHPDAHLHIAHVSTGAEIDLIKKAKSHGLNVTCEVSPHHLLFTDDDYVRLGSRIKMNPAVKTEADRSALCEAVRNGTIDIIATDHAPHTLTEKQGDALTAVSGAPMVQFSLPLMLDMFGPEIVTRVMSENPARIFGMKNYGRIAAGCLPNFVIVENLKNGYIVSDAEVVSKCGWTPITGRRLYHRVVRTILPKPQALKFTR